MTAFMRSAALRVTLPKLPEPMRKAFEAGPDSSMYSR